MAEFTNEILIDAPADEVWAVVAAAERQAEWFPGMLSSTVEDGIRTIGTAAGGFLFEKILSVDHEQMRFEYTITGPLQFDHHLGALQVDTEGDSSRVSYTQEIRPEALTYALRAATGDALIGLKDLVETGTYSRGFQAADGEGA
ncbi:MAG: SRPBCC family protein [Actinobacteria bacterium]|jgi:carbon monoxide dehydrogenase subunit G|nr:SRPBCC family protein [Actinomycetota bacterium]MBT3687702.1 SRPBCC family protein [Actinomycetota bacterium]MBT4036964.1 SRPBCC family protein [Actinomycetota bacterium]MBT4279213.1 SRPBCC family protein [Actinomycetota bacterium]MBT4344111.1 SRPBCC family protein [Actinomycetota bacterium]